jgi:hypothetical protein
MLRKKGTENRIREKEAKAGVKGRRLDRDFTSRQILFE